MPRPLSTSMVDIDIMDDEAWRKVSPNTLDLHLASERSNRSNVGQAEKNRRARRRRVREARRANRRS